MLLIHTYFDAMLVLNQGGLGSSISTPRLLMSFLGSEFMVNTSDINIHSKKYLETETSIC